jgi:hypothetical protein
MAGEGGHGPAHEVAQGEQVTCGVVKGLAVIDLSHDSFLLWVIDAAGSWAGVSSFFWIQTEHHVISLARRPVR